jgi:hypothetical protein
MTANWNALAELDLSWTILSAPHKKFGQRDPHVASLIRGQGARVKALERYEYDKTKGRYHSYYYFVIKEPRASQPNA